MALIRYLLDTNSGIEYIAGALPQKAVIWLDSIIETEVAISVINQIEMLGFNPPNPADLLPFEELTDTLKILPLDEAIVRETIVLRKAHKIKLPDAIIAATAIVYGLLLITRNESDFKKVTTLSLINLHNMV
jgi:predicted nucleic acid-binding protein